jgi:large subunit ribosomal protein L18
MIRKYLRNQTRKRVHIRLRKKLSGKTERPRLNVFRSVKHIYAQLVDDTLGYTLAAASTREKKFSGNSGGNVEAAKFVGTQIAARALEKGVRQVAFDRGGYHYHGRVKALADAAREGGLKF